MNEPFDKKLRQALRPIDPGEDFTQRVMSQIQSQDATHVRRFQGTARWPVRARWLTAAMAASIAAITVITLQVREQQERAAGLRARQQVLEALQVTSEKLNVAYRVVRDQSRSLEVDADPGA